MTALILKHASASRPSGEWNDDNYDVLADGAVVGRIMEAAPEGMPMALDIGVDHRADRTPTPTKRHARPRWRRSRRAGGGNDCRHLRMISCNPALAGGDRMQFDQLKRREFITLLGGTAAGSRGSELILVMLPKR
jgi:hypothetical protein